MAQEVSSIRKWIPVALVGLLAVGLGLAVSFLDLPDIRKLVDETNLDFGPLTWFFILFFSTFVTEDLTCIFAGLLVSRNIIGFELATVGCFSGILVGDSIVFLVGRYYGRAALKLKWVRRFISPSAEHHAETFFRERGPWLIIGTRFLPGSRLPTYFAAGVLRTHPGVFFFFFALAGILWTPALVGLASLIGRVLVPLFEQYATWALPVFILAGALLLLGLRLAELMSTHKGRRLLLGRWRRHTRWEFWPAWIFYLPLVPWVLWLVLRHRSITLPTLVNPAMPLGGLVGESKVRILESLQQAAPGQVAPFRLLPPGPALKRLAQLQAFQISMERPWPVVLKPDIGERGTGVGIITDATRTLEFLKEHPEPLIAQKFIPGEEFGVFYIRKPGRNSGEIFSITEKQLVSVTGDGVRTLEVLILDDDRAVCMAPTYIRRFPDAMDRIPAPGERVRLVDVGTHSRGALFLDAGRLGTTALQAAMNQIVDGYPGFHFGRFDIRVPSREHLQRGEGIQILELNGLTSEATHIYHPGTPLLSAYRTLAEQWRRAFEIGADLRRHGASPPKLGAVLRALRLHLADT